MSKQLIEEDPMKRKSNITTSSKILASAILMSGFLALALHSALAAKTDEAAASQVKQKEFDTPQCGYCQSGMIMSALALLQQRPSPTDAEIDASVTNACRCGTYHRIRQAIHRASALMKA